VVLRRYRGAERRATAAARRGAGEGPGRLARQVAAGIQGLPQSERGDEDAAVVPEERMAAAIGDDLRTEELAAELRPVPGGVDDERAAVVAEHAAIRGTDQFCVTYERPFVDVDAARVAREQRVGERVRAVDDHARPGRGVREHGRALGLVPAHDRL